MQLGEFLAISAKGYAIIPQLGANLNIMGTRHHRTGIGIGHARKQENQRKAKGDIAASKTHVLYISDGPQT